MMAIIRKDLEEIRKYCPRITQSEIIGRYGEANIYHICEN